MTPSKIGVGYPIEIYKRLCAARERIAIRHQLGLPFVSVAGSNYAQARRKVLFVGKSLWATEDEGEIGGDCELSFSGSCDWS